MCSRGRTRNFLWSKENRGARGRQGVRWVSATGAPSREVRRWESRECNRGSAARIAPAHPRTAARRTSPMRRSPDAHEARNAIRPSSASAIRRKNRRAGAVADLEAKIAEREQAMKDIESAMSAPAFTITATRPSPLSTVTRPSCGRSESSCINGRSCKRITEMPPRTTIM